MRVVTTGRRFWILLLIPTSATVLQAALCGSSITDGNPEAPLVDVTVELRNLDTPVVGQDIHILGPGEGFNSTNRLEPGQSRNLIINMRDGRQVTFTAGRNGVTLFDRDKTCSCNSACPTVAGGAVGNPKVQWDGSSLSCVGW